MIESVKIVSFNEVRGAKTVVVTFSMEGFGFFCDAIKCEDLIQLGQACKNHEMGEAQDKIDMVELAEDLVLGGNK